MKVACPACNQVLDLPDADAGRVVNCPSCGGVMQVPVIPAAIPVAAPVAPRPAASVSPGAPVRRPEASIGDDPAMRMLLPVGRSGLAIAAGYLGLFSFLIFPAPICLLVSILAVRDLNRNRDKHGMGRAVFGLIMGILGSVFLAIMLVAMATGR